ncbi:class I SAM-dependent methyltransferase [uncultured Veillonella sp.]|uniref:tRNA (adenine(22)-N(1))-methyltransferase n=1 Tax=uncultured Veillonella sp. TaxID=159268 RepID=UPI002622549A|nr:class I SAM-dependent methyltransferase [uncultured Veillonella sp.]
MQIKKMTNRLEAVFTLIPKVEVIADIGTDHGYLAVELVRRGRARAAIAGDVNKGPLASAKSYVMHEGLAAQVDCRLGNGLQVVRRGEIQGAVICGMGGFLMRDIIAAGPELLDFYVLQPQNGQAELRQYLVEQGYRIVAELIVTDMGKLYTALLALKKGREAVYVSESGPVTKQVLDKPDVYGQLAPQSILWAVGAHLANERPPLWDLYIKHLMHIRESALASMTESLKDTPKYQELQAELRALGDLKDTTKVL